MDRIVLLVGVVVPHRVTVQCVHPKDFKFRTVRYTLSVVKIVEIYMFVFFLYRTYNYIQIKNIRNVSQQTKVLFGLLVYVNIEDHHTKHQNVL